jgi:hypothetical protein
LLLPRLAITAVAAEIDLLWSYSFRTMFREKHPGNPDSEPPPASIAHQATAAVTGESGRGQAGDIDLKTAPAPANNRKSHAGDPVRSIITSNCLDCGLIRTGEIQMWRSRLRQTGVLPRHEYGLAGHCGARLKPADCIRILGTDPESDESSPNH